MADFEELKIAVNFSDNGASDKLKSLNSEMGKFHSETSGKAAQGFKSATELTTKFGTEIRGVANAFGLLGNLPIFNLGAGAGFAGVLVALKKTNDALGTFAKELLGLRDVARTAGLTPDQFKNIANQFRMVGFSSEKAQSTVVSFFRTLDEAGRAGTAQFQRIWTESNTPELTLARIQQMRALVRSGKPAQAVKEAITEAKAIMDREMRSGHGMQEARRQTEAFLSTVGLDLDAMDVDVENLKDFLDDPTKWQRRIERAQEFNREYEKFNRLTKEVGAEVDTELLPVLMELNEALLRGGGLFQEMRDTISTDIEDIRKVIALLEGDMQKFGSLLPPGPLRRLVTGNTQPAHETEGPPTAYGEYPIGSSGWREEQFKNVPGPGLTPDQSERYRRRFRRGSSYEEQQKQKDALREDVNVNDSLLKETARLNQLLFENAAETDLQKLKNLSTKTPGLQGVPGGPSGTVNNDLSEGGYSALTGGTKGYNELINAAHAENIPPSQAAGGETPLVGTLPDVTAPTRQPTKAEVLAGTAVAPQGKYGGVHAGEQLTQLPGIGTALKSPYTGADKNLSGITEGTGVASHYGTLPGTQKGSGRYYDVGQDTPGSARIRDQLGLKYYPEEHQGIALGSKETLGQWFNVQLPDGRTFVWRQTDTGPNILNKGSTGKFADLSAGALAEAGFYGNKDFSEGVVKVTAGGMPTREQLEKLETADPKLLTKADYAMLDKYRQLPEDPAARQVSEATREARAASGGEQVAQKAVDDSFYPSLASEDLPGMSFSQRAKYGRMSGRRLPDSPISTNVEDRRRLDLSGDPGGLEGTGDQGPVDWDLPVWRRTRMPKPQGPGLSEQLGYGDIDRSGMDQALAADSSSVDASGKLDVNVRGAPADVKVEGDGMFKDNTTLSQQVDL